MDGAPSSIHHPFIHPEMKKRDYEGHQDVHINIPVGLLKRIDEFCEKYHKNYRTDGLRNLVEVGLVCIENWDKMKSRPDVIEELYRQLEEGTLVDEIQKMDNKQFKILHSIFETENMARTSIKKETVEAWRAGKLY